MARKDLVDGLKIFGMTLNGKYEDCILGRQTRCPFDGTTEKNMSPLELVSFDLWGPSCNKSVGGEIYLMIIVNVGTSFEYGAYILDKSDPTTLETFKIFHKQIETATGKKIQRLLGNVTGL